ncbi:MAG: serine/threonine protein kinase [Sandaracinaceae bacterium]|jgi:hypothetical protein|nr:serine/threonine protein kinase [Sandaracinaceae bacterium]
MSDLPRTIGRYTIDRLIGSGAMGNVFLGRDPELDRAVAIKTVRDQGLGSDALAMFLTRFKNEARAAARLSHPSIVSVYDVGEDPGVGPYLVFEYVSGSTLKEVLQSRGPLGPIDAIALAENVARAIDTAHAAGVIHRDIKPDNLLVTSEGQTKLADFGVARVPNAALTREGQFLGTPCYAAPETLAGGTYGPSSDIFSFAAVLYEAISGVRAFPGDDALSVAQKVLHDEPRPPGEVARSVNIPAQVDAVIMRGLSKDPATRTKSATELARALRNAYVASGTIDKASATQSQSGAFVATTPKEPHGGTGWVFAAVIAGGLAIGAVLILWLGREDVSSDELLLEDLDAGVDLGVAPQLILPGTSAASQDAGTRVDAGGHVDAGPQNPDLGATIAPVDTTSTMTAGEREDAAKDALTRARDSLAHNQLLEAREALEQARRLDPGNSDIEIVARDIAAHAP